MRWSIKAWHAFSTIAEHLVSYTLLFINTMLKYVITFEMVMSTAVQLKETSHMKRFATGIMTSKITKASELALFKRTYITFDFSNFY